MYGIYGLRQRFDDQDSRAERRDPDALQKQLSAFAGKADHQLH